ncbi:hypothetical protein N7509_009689 [Penicillium cosmopolitanum]|uniref:Uncharacterized protein n=1 Tax=Penicillium cosmopolitanum TaxID=1131564 RepID=A0A9W9VPY2_9EURO|nr:uncharacterized protein N7509_009689 [Penicillium cosmopolitanum]KAJ5387148.1 hypothetical protein N7509_009689 [Penicillium cosmopolitanum]
MQPPLPSLTATWHNASYPSISSSRSELSVAGKTIIVTGAGSGIGRATAVSFSRAGASNIILIGRTKSTLEETQKLLACASSVYVADITDEKRIAEVAASVGIWDILILAAAYISSPASIQDASVNDWWQNLETNLKGSLIAVKSLLPTANTTHATVIGYTAAITFPAAMLPGLSAYAISKLAIVKLMEYIVAENPSIFTAALHPGMVETDIFKASGTDPAAVPLDSVELAGDFAVWLASKEASFLNGRYVWANWDVDELKEKAGEIQSGQLLTANIQGWPFGSA